MTDTQYSMTAIRMIHESQGCENEQTQSAQDTEQVVETLRSCCTDTNNVTAHTHTHKCYSLDEEMNNTYVWEEQANTLTARCYKQPIAVLVPRKVRNG